MGTSNEWPHLGSLLARGGGQLSVVTVLTGLVVGASTLAIGVPAVGAAGVTGNERAQAKQAFLVKSDLPKGWTSSKNTISGNTSGLGTGDAAADQQLVSCTGLPSSLIEENPPNVLGPEFDSSGNQAYSVGQQVVFFHSAAAAKSFKSAVASTKLPGCMQSLAQGPLSSKLLGSVPKGVTIGTISVTAAPASSLPAGAAGVTISFPFTEQGTTVKITVTEAMAVKGNVAQEISFDGAGTPFPVSLQKHLVSVAASRL